MKKVNLIFVAVLAAIALSAFTPAAAPTIQTAWFQDDSENWVSQDLPVCTAGSNPVCEVPTMGFGTRRIFQSASPSNPYTKQ